MMTRARGFTLVELVIVIVLMGILAATASIFIAGPIQGYLDTNRRAQLSDSADTTMRRLARDLRLALPNSVRVGGNNLFLEYIPTLSGGRYRAFSAANNLNFGVATNLFDYWGDAVVAGAGNFVVVFNTGQRSAGACAAPGGADAYEGCNRSAITAATAATITITPRTFSFSSPANRFHIVPASGPVTLACENVNTINSNGTGTLRAYGAYMTGNGDWGAAAPVAAPAGAGRTTSLLAQFVSGCAFVYAPGVTSTNGLVTLRLTLTRNGETVTLHHQIHVDNAP